MLGLIRTNPYRMKAEERGEQSLICDISLRGIDVVLHLGVFSELGHPGVVWP